MSQVLVVYYSWSNGNTKRMAEKVAKALQATLARIDTVQPYQGSYNDVVDQGKREVDRGYMPPIQNVDISKYDVIIVGTPTWWYTMAPAMHTFLHDHDWQGKTVIPFMTNGGWPGHVIKDMKKACKQANIELPMEIQFDSNGGDHLETDPNEIDQWIENIKKVIA